MKSILFIVLVLIIACLNAAIGAELDKKAKSNNSVERNIVQAIVDDLKAFETSKKNQKEKIKRRILSKLDFQAISQKVLGSHYTAISPGQRSTFISLFKKLMLRHLSGTTEENKKGKKSRSESYKIKILPDPKFIKNNITIKSILSKKGEIDTEINYLFQKQKIIDLIIDDESLTDNYREQFIEIINDDGFNALIKMMRTKLKKVS